MVFFELQGRTQEVTVRMMDIDNEHLGIPDQEYSSIVTMPASEFQVIVHFNHKTRHFAQLFVWLFKSNLH